MKRNLKVRRAAFDNFLQKHKNKVDIGNRIIHYSCPCCGYPALTVKEGGYDYCFVCSWEDDGQDDDTGINTPSSANHGLTLSEARKNFAKYLDITPNKVRDEYKTIRKQLIFLYETLLNEQEPFKDKKIMDEIRLCYKQYTNLMAKSISTYAESV